MSASETVVVTGGAGYVGAGVCLELLSSGRSVRALDVLLHGQAEVADQLERSGAEVLRGDVRDPDARSAALRDATAVVHLAAIVGDPACARDPELAREVNVEASRALVADARASGVRRFVFASTCSNYGRMADTSAPIDESSDLAPVSLYAEQKVEIEKMLLNGSAEGVDVTCLRLATVYGVAPRMRFDLTVNEFVRDLWADRHLEVFGEQFWRPYVHVRDAGRAIRLVLEAPIERVRGNVFNVGRSDQNFRKLDLVELTRRRIPTGTVDFVERTEDPRDYKVSFEKIRDELGYDVTMTVPAGIDEVATSLEAGTFPDPFSGRYRNIP
jgi:nucleoside-diphosphate-sugar epimerase